MKYNISVLFDVANDEAALDVANSVKKFLNDSLDVDVAASAQIAIAREGLPEDEGASVDSE